MGLIKYCKIDNVSEGMELEETYPSDQDILQRATVFGLYVLACEFENLDWEGATIEMFNAKNPFAHLLNRYSDKKLTPDTE